MRGSRSAYEYEPSQPLGLADASTSSVSYDYEYGGSEYRALQQYQVQLLPEAVYDGPKIVEVRQQLAGCAQN